MKKVALSLLAFGLVGALAVAQDAPVAKVSGYFNTGILGTKDGSKTAAGKASPWVASEYADDDGADSTIGRISGSVSTDTYGVDVGAEVSDVAEGGGTASLEHAKAWAQLYDGLFLRAGTAYNDAFDGIDDESDDNFVPGNGYGLTYANSGFTVGAWEDYTTALGFGAAFKNDMFEVRGTLKTNQSHELSAYAVSASVSAIEKLTLNGGVFASGLDLDDVDTAASTTYVGTVTADDASGTNQAVTYTASTTAASDTGPATALDFTVAYAITDALTGGVVVYDYLNLAGDLDTDTYASIQPYVTYKLTDAFTLGGYYTYYTDGQANKADDATSVGADSKIKVKGTYALPGSASLIGWYDYTLGSKDQHVYLEYLVSF